MPLQFSCVPLRSTSENCAVLPCFSDFGCFPTAHFLTFPQRILAAFAMILVLLFCNQVFLKGVIVVKTAVMTHMKSSAMRIPMWIPYLGVCLPFGLMQFQALDAVLRLIFPDEEVKTV